ncbi:hypothetical protein SeMB42_g02092 [Synchytrium endobioticum]|uniref:Potassium channel domain-containing protein n=1 Tax=Synchytrium endobioticum TaxID=286115 RepID=A0A507DHT5_9FUNG|nr:hypothetical protein SeMB42_g02092 [Synchytrium endobioticum]
MAYRFANFIPLIEGLLVPTTLLLNVQSLGTPTWLAFEDDDAHLLSSSTMSWHTTSNAKQYLETRSPAVLTLEFISMAFGILANTSLFVRMLEKKIKWTTRLAGIGSLLQGFFGLLVVGLFVAQTAPLSDKYHYTEGLFYALASCCLSLVNGGLFIYQRHLHRNQIYEHIMYELSIPQRQLVLAAICTYSYVIMGALLYGFMEGWMFDDAVYWCVVTLTTIGFGDLTPQTWEGKLLLPLFAGCGIALVGTIIYSLRVVVLEITTLHLASRFVRHFGMDHDKSHHASPELPSDSAHGTYHDNSIHGQLGIASLPTPVVRRQSYGGPPLLDRLSTSYEPPQSILVGMRSGSLDSSRPLLEAVMAEPLLHAEEDVKIPEVSDTTPLLLQAPPTPGATTDDTIIHAAYDTHNFELSGAKQLLSRQQSNERSRMKKLRFPRSFTSSDVENGRLNTNSRAMVISRGTHLPRLTLIAGNEVKRRQVVEMTRATFQKQIRWATAAVIGNLLLFGAVFATLEDWQFLDGVYFCFVALTTIGYGDVTPKTDRAKSLFIWYIFVGIACVTYLGSMIGERFQDSWTVEISKIERRTDRYEKKAELKKRYRASVMASRKNRANGHYKPLTSEKKTRRKNATGPGPISISQATPTLTRMPSMSMASAPARGIVRIDRRTSWDSQTAAFLLSRSMGSDRFMKRVGHDDDDDDTSSEDEDSDHYRECEQHSDHETYSDSDGDHGQFFTTEEDELAASSSSAR